MSSPSQSKPQASLRPHADFIIGPGGLDAVNEIALLVIVSRKPRRHPAFYEIGKRLVRPTSRPGRSTGNPSFGRGIAFVDLAKTEDLA